MPKDTFSFDEAKAGSAGGGETFSFDEAKAGAPMMPKREALWDGTREAFSQISKDIAAAYGPGGDSGAGKPGYDAKDPRAARITAADRLGHDVGELATAPFKDVADFVVNRPLSRATGGAVTPEDLKVIEGAALSAPIPLLGKGKAAVLPEAETAAADNVVKMTPKPRAKKKPAEAPPGPEGVTPPPEPQTPPTPGAEPAAAGPKKRTRKPTKLAGEEPQVFSFEEAKQPAAPEESAWTSDREQQFRSEMREEGRPGAETLGDAPDPDAPFNFEEANKPAEPEVEPIGRARYRLKQETEAVRATPDSASHPDVPLLLEITDSPDRWSSEDRLWAAKRAEEIGRPDIRRVLLDRMQHALDVNEGREGLAATQTPEQVQRQRERAAALRSDLESLNQKPATEPESLNASRAHAGKGAPRFEARDVLPDEELVHLDNGLADLGRRLSQTLGLTVYQGRKVPKGAAGVYYIKPGVIRMGAIHEMNTLSHEAGHHLDYRKFPTLKAMQTRYQDQFGQIADIFYGGGGMFQKDDPLRPIEGFAEFFRLYMTNPEEITRIGGERLVQEFETALGKDNPQALALMQEIRAHHGALVNAPSMSLAMSHVADATPPSTIDKVLDSVRMHGGGALTLKGWASFGRSVADEVWTSMFDRFNPMKVALDELSDISERRGGKRLNLETFEDPYKLLRMSPGARAAAHMDIRHGVASYHTMEAEGPSLTDALGVAMMPAGSEAEMAEWLTAKRELDVAHEEELKRRAEEALAKGEMPAFDPDFRPDYKSLPAPPEGKWNRKRYREFSTYLNARNMLQQWRRFQRGERELPPDGNIFGGPQVYAQTIETAERLNPHWTHAADLMHDFAKSVWKLRYDAGLIDGKTYMHGLLAHPDYMPASRVMTGPSDELLGMRVGGGMRRTGGTGKTAGGVRQMRGSTRAVVDPIWSLAQQTYELRTLIARNDAMKAFRDVAKQIEGGGAIMDQVPAHKLKATQFDLIEAINNLAKERGLDERDELELEQSVEMMKDVFGDDTRTKVFRPTDAGEHGENFIYIWDKGERQMWQLPNTRLGNHLLSMFANMNRPVRGTILNVLANPARVLRLGVTLHPKFFLANIQGDQLTVAALQKGYVPFKDWVVGIREELKPAKLGDVTQRYNRAMGAVGGMQTAAERSVMGRRSIEGLISRGFTFHELPEKMAAASELSETGTRIGLFKKREAEARERLSEGLTDEQKAAKQKFIDWAASMHASYEARDILDFDLRGAHPWMQGVTRTIPFLNANLQAVSKAVRTAFADGKALDYLMGKKPRTPQEAREAEAAVWAWMAIGTYAAVGLMTRAANANNPNYMEVADYLRSTHWVFPVPWSKTEFLVMKKPYEMAALSDVVEGAYEAIALHDPTALARGFGEAAQLLIPSAISPPILEIPFNLAKNRDQFDQPIVPENLKKVEPRDQETEYTSGIAKAVGHLLNQSPAQWDYAIKAATGHWGGDALKAVDRLDTSRPEVADDLPDMFTVSRFVRDVTRGSRSTKTFWNGVETLNQKEESLRLRVMDKNREAEALKYYKDMSPVERGWAMINLFGKGQEKELHPMVNAQKRYVAIAGLAHDLQTNLGVLDPRTNKPMELTPRQRKDAIDALHYLNMAQTHNALVDMRQPGYERAARLDTLEPQAKLHAANPALSDQLRLREAENKVLPPAQAKRAWEAIRHRYEDVSEAQLRMMIEAKQAGGRGALVRHLRQDATHP